MRLLTVISLLDRLETTAEVATPNNPFQRIVGQTHAVRIVQSAVKQHRHVLLCGVPGIGKSMLAKAAYSLLKPPTQEIILRKNLNVPDRPIVVVSTHNNETYSNHDDDMMKDIIYIQPDRLPFDIAVKMGYRCQRCNGLSMPNEPACADCGAPKRYDWSSSDFYHGLFRVLDIVSEPALRTVTSIEEVAGESIHVKYERLKFNEISVTKKRIRGETVFEPAHKIEEDQILVALDAKRFIRVSGASHVELLGDVKHDPYGSAESLGTSAHQRVIPGAIHEAHEGILYIDEVSALGPYQSHLLTAMQDKIYPISGHNPLSSGAAVRVDDVPCDFILFASCNTETVGDILPALRSRIRGYGYEIMLSSSMEKTKENIDSIVRFAAQTVEEDGRIPHLKGDAVREVVRVAESFAFQFDGRKQALTLRLRELGGLIRIAGDLAVQEEEQLVLPEHVKNAEVLSRGIDMNSPYYLSNEKAESISKDYFF
ncbi:Lon protease family protein [Candidatus Thorarchaeota archaeon]|nr:MAG: Lon protease family protein [Candidatus Thorarchaeota archaeon]